MRLMWPISMTTVGFCPSVREAWERATELCFRLFPCLSDPARRSAWGLKAALLLMHLVIVGVLFLFDRDLIQKTRKERWYTSIYLVLFAATLFQYFFTSSSSPGYVVDAMKAWNEAHATFTQTPRTSKQTASSKDGSLVCPMAVPQLERSISGTNSSPWVKQVMNLYPLGLSRRNWTCSYCNVIQPPRTKHCHDCEKCVLQFDHHCVWLGTCIGQGNHCRFWWYIFEESILSIWTSILYISFLKANTTRQWWKDAVAIFLLAILLIALIFLLLLLLFHSYLILTNQTTYELVRRRRITYLRGVPDRIYPFSKGICRNLYNFCFSRTSIYSLERLPTAEELEAKAKPYTCVDVISCRCC